MASATSAPPLPAKKHSKPRGETKTSKDGPIKFFHRVSKKAFTVAYKIDLPELKVFKATSSKFICSIDLSKVRAIDLKNGVVVALRLNKRGKEKGKSEQFRFKDSTAAKEWVEHIKTHIGKLPKRPAAQVTPKSKANTSRVFGPQTPKPKPKTFVSKKKAKRSGGVIDLSLLADEVQLRKDGDRKLGIELRRQPCSIVGGAPMTSMIIVARASGQAVVAGMAAGDVIFKAMGRPVRSLQQFASTVRDQSTIRLQVYRANDPAPLLAATATKSIAVNFLSPDTETNSARASTTPSRTTPATMTPVSSTTPSMATPTQSFNSAVPHHSHTPNTSLFATAEPPRVAANMQSPFASVHATLDGLQSSSMMERARRIGAFGDTATIFSASTTPVNSRPNIINDLVEDTNLNFSNHRASANRGPNKWSRSPSMQAVAQYRANDTHTPHSSYLSQSPSMRKLNGVGDSPYSHTPYNNTPQRPASEMHAFADPGTEDDELDMLDDSPEIFQKSRNAQTASRQAVVYNFSEDPRRAINSERPTRTAPSSNPALQSRQPKPNSRNSSTNHYRPVDHDRTALTHHADTNVSNSTVNQRDRQSNSSPPRENGTLYRRPTLYVRTTPNTPASKHADTKVPSGTTNQSAPSYAQPALSPGGSLSTSISNVNSHASSTPNSGISLKHDTLEPCDHFRPRRFSKRCKTCGKSKRLHRQKALMRKGFAVGDAVEGLYKKRWYSGEVADLSLLHKGLILIRFPRYNTVQRLKPHQVRAIAHDQTRNSAQPSTELVSAARSPDSAAAAARYPQQPESGPSWQASSDSTNSVGFSDSEEVETSVSQPSEQPRSNEHVSYHSEEKTQESKRIARYPSSASDLVVPTAAKLAMLPTSVEPLEDDRESLASKHPSLAPSLLSNPGRVEIPHAHRSVSIADLGERFSTLSSTISEKWNDRKGMHQKFHKVHTKLHGLGVGLKNIERSKSEMQTAIKHSKRLDEQLGPRPKPPRIRHAPSSVLGISIPAPPERKHVPRIYRGLSTASLALIQPKQSANDILSPLSEDNDHYDGGFLSANSDTEDDDDKDVEWFDVADPAMPPIPRMLTAELNNF